MSNGKKYVVVNEGVRVSEVVHSTIGEAEQEKASYEKQLTESKKSSDKLKVSEVLLG